MLCSKAILFFTVGRAAAIVSPIAGTTRDVVEVPINISGYPVLVADTAGQRTSPSDQVEQEGIRRARTWTKSADLAVLVLDAQKVNGNFNFNLFVSSLGPTHYQDFRSER